MSVETATTREAGMDAVYGRSASTFRRRLAFSALSVTLLLGVLGSFLAWRQYQDGKDQAVAEMRSRVVLAATVFDTYFAGQLTTLNSIAASPSIVNLDSDALGAYFQRVQGSPEKPLFTGGIGWIDRRGYSQFTDTHPHGPPIDVSDRIFFKRVVATGAPFISEGLRTRRNGKPAIVMAVPTRDAQRRLTGVLVGALQLVPSPTSKRSIDLGFEGLVVIDRKGQQLTLQDFARPRNIPLLRRIRTGDGAFADSQGLDGASGRVVAYANSKAAGWTVALDRPRSTVFASARRSFVIELISIALAALVVLAIVAWAIARSRRELGAERDRVRRWDELAQSLGEASQAVEVATALGTALSDALPGAHVIVTLHDDEGGAFRFWTFGGGREGPLDRHASGIGRVARLAFNSGSPLRISEPAAVETVLAPLRAKLSSWPAEIFALPMRSASGLTIGSVTLLLQSGSSLESEEALVVAHTEYAARALRRARRSEREHDVAITLQRSLLPAALPPVEGLSLAGRYNAGAEGLEVGGDWYGAVRRPDGIVHLTVGDVAGRGVSAAVLMGQLRYAFRTLAFEHTSPAEIARRLTRLVPDNGMATATFLTLDPYTGELRYTSAGHPPSLLLDVVSGKVTLLEDASSPPLGWADPKLVTEKRLTLRSQMTLLAYTDGLVERRGTSIDEGIERVAAQLRAHPELGVDEAADALVEAVTAELSLSDDIAVLLVQLHEVPATMSVEIPADPLELRTLRSRLGIWLERRGLTEEQRIDTVLAVSEACNNAIEHAYRHGGGTIRLALEHGAGTLRISVEDNGTWRAADSDPTRGRGLQIMRETMDSASVVSAPTGTRVDLELNVSDGAAG